MRRRVRKEDEGSAASESDFGVEDLAALIEQSARGARAPAAMRSSVESVDEKLLPVESLLEAQIDFNNSVGSSIRIIAQHLLYLRKKFEAVEKNAAQDAARESAQASEATAGREQAVPSALEDVGRAVESLARRLSELEQRVERELNEIKRSRRGLGASKRGDAKRRGKGRS